LSARPFSQADMPFGLAFRLYDAFSAAVQRKCTWWVARSLAGMGGLPLGRLVSMTELSPTQIIIDKPPSRVFNVYTLTNPTKEPYMNNATLEAFRSIAAAMQSEPQEWQWIGKHMSQRMFGISEQRAKDYAQRFGGEAKQMEVA
jgi:hypothetical protein